jgi:hypothetical protein
VTVVPTRYVNEGTIPKKVQPGRVLVHNHVIHGTHWGCDINGFRAWTQPKRVERDDANAAVP